jgi:alkylation response protein AidB-like acyl-CoA dehydrogenase
LELAQGNRRPKIMTDTRLSREPDAFRGAVREFAEETLGLLADRIYKEARFNTQAFEEAPSMGLLGVTFPEERGDTGGIYVPYTTTVEEIGGARASTGLSYAAHTSLATMASGKTQKFQLREAAVERHEFLETADTA